MQVRFSDDPSLTLNQAPAPPATLAQPSSRSSLTNNASRPPSHPVPSMPAFNTGRTSAPVGPSGRPSAVPFYPPAS
eukprot:6176821-Lingulodinium_polyedra.AAC.1